MAERKSRSGGQILCRLLFFAYAVLMLWLLFGQRIDAAATAADNWNLTPLKTLKLYLKMLSQSSSVYLVRHAFINLVGNVVMFIPLGFFLPAVWGKLRKLFRCVLCAAVLIATIEAIQYVSGLGSCDVDDLLLNLPGVIIGFLLWKLFVRP